MSADLLVKSYPLETATNGSRKGEDRLAWKPYYWFRLFNYKQKRRKQTVLLVRLCKCFEVGQMRTCLLERPEL